MLNDPTVAVQNLSKTYRIYSNGSSRSLFPNRFKSEVHAVKKVSFVAYKGESVGVLGKNGSGKSTLLSMIAGNEAPTSGSVRVSSPPALLSISAALQPHLSGRSNVRLGLLAMGLSKDEVAEMIEPVCSWANLNSAIDRPLNTYSSGMKSRLKFSISTAVHRDILLIDEALSAGDATFAEKAKERMDAFLAEAGTVFFVSHGAGEIRKQCNRALWMNEGELIADGDVEEITSAYRAFSKFLAEENDEKCQKIIARMQKVFPPQIVLFDDQVARLLDNSGSLRAPSN